MAQPVSNIWEPASLQLLSPTKRTKFVENLREAPETSSKVARWGVNWVAPCLMISFLASGVALAIGHHVYYNSLDGTPVESASQQQWATRIGFGLAFVAKVALVASMIISFEQHVWTTVKRKAIRLKAIDAMFSMAYSPLSFFNTEVLAKAKVLTILCLFIWTVPLIAVVTPTTLSVHLQPVTSSNMTVVPTVDFSVANGSLWSDYIGVGWPTRASPIVNRMLTAVSSSMQIAAVVAPAVNASYMLQFNGPALKCQLLQDAESNTHSFQASFTNHTDLTSVTDLWNSDVGWNGTSVVRSWWEAKIPFASPLTSNLIFIRLGGSYPNDHLQKNISCQQWNTTYDVQFDYSNGIQTTTITNLNYLSPFNTTLYEIPTYQMPPDGQPYIAMQLAFSALLTGHVYSEPGLSSNGLAGGDLPITNTGLFMCPEIREAQREFGPFIPDLSSMAKPWMCRNGSVEAALEDLSRNFTISLMSDRLLGGQTSTNVTYSSFQNFWAYNAKDLLAAYSAGVAATVVCLLIGLCALWNNGYSADTSFSSIMFTTRNADLDALSVGQCLGAKPLPKDVGKVALRFGMMENSTRFEDGVGHAAFGTAGTVRSLKPGEKCA